MPVEQDSLRITEIFYSLQGESSTVGQPTVFIRLTGCPLRCVYCDSEYAFHGGKKWSFDAITAELSQYPATFVTVSGGEPLAQPGCIALLKQLCDKGYQVSIETSGAMDIAIIDPRVMIVMDIKTPDSKEASRNRLENLHHLKPIDQVKFVVCSKTDFNWAIAFVKDHKLSPQSVLFSPCYRQVSERELADWILAGDVPVRFQFQLHKLLWGDTPGV